MSDRRTAVALDRIGRACHGVAFAGRVKDQLWLDYGADPDAPADQYLYGHDRNSNRLYRTNELSADKDELYAYDGLDRLAKAERGTGTTSASPSIASVKRERNYTLNALGDWSGYLTKADTGGGLNTDLDQTRDHNAVNEIWNATAGEAISGGGKGSRPQEAGLGRRGQRFRLRRSRHIDSSVLIAWRQSWGSSGR
jgi:hypothetical protein